MSKEKEALDEYPELIYAIDKQGGNGILCLDYSEYDTNIEYIREDIFNKKIEQLKAEITTTRNKPGSLIIELHEKRKQLDQLKAVITEVKKFHDRLPSEWFSEQIYGIMEDTLNE